ncbi:MAG: TonB-dependent receptor plug domain-containing protein [Saprospiraceae bacterium]|nr:TonB-dependent receptor plug domain-containing protein [Saprospiraceae bacterium]
MIRILSVFFYATICVTVLAQSTFRGKAIDQSSIPIAGIHVVFNDQTVVTDQQGLFRLSDVTKAKLPLLLHGIGYDSLFQFLSVEGLDSVRVFTMSEKIYAFAPIELSGSWISSDEPFTYNSMEKSEIEDRNVGQDVPFILRWMPSTVVTSDAGTGIGYTGIRIRGSDPSRTNVTIDGIPLNDAESHGVFWVNLPDLAGSADEIQMQRGVGTSAQGAGAFGGTINVKTERFSAEPHATYAGSIGAFRTRKNSLQFGTGLLADHFTVEGRVSKINSDGFIDRGSADLRSLYLSATYLDDRQSLKVKMLDGKEITYQAWNGVPAQYLNDPVLRTYNSAGERSDGSFHPNEVDDYNQTHFHAIYNRDFHRGVVGQLGIHYTKGSGFFEQYRIEDPFEAYGLMPVSIGDTMITSSDLIRRRWLDNDFYGAIFSISRQRGGARVFDWTIGGGYNYYLGRHFGEVTWARSFTQGEQGLEYYRNDASKHDANIYGQVTYELFDKTELFADLQWRHIDYSFQGFNQLLQASDQEVNLLFFNPKFGLSRFDGQRHWYYSFGVGHREPNRDDYVDSSPASRPKPEVLLDHEAGMRWKTNRTQGSANVYYMQYRDQLILTGAINDVGAYVRTNVPDSYRLGLEVAVAHQLSNKLHLSFQATFSDNRIKEFEEGIDDWDSGSQATLLHSRTPIAFSPSSLVQAGVQYRMWSGKRGSLEADWQQKYVGKQYLDNTGREASQLDAYFVSDMHVRFRLAPRWAKEISVGLLIQNLFDLDIVSNGWIYRFQSEGYDPRNDDPHARSEGEGRYNLTGYYPQAGRNALLNVRIGL